MAGTVLLSGCAESRLPGDGGATPTTEAAPPDINLEVLDVRYAHNFVYHDAPEYYSGERAFVLIKIGILNAGGTPVELPAQNDFAIRMGDQRFRPHTVEEGIDSVYLSTGYARDLYRKPDEKLRPEGYTEDWLVFHVPRIDEELVLEADLVTEKLDRSTHLSGTDLPWYVVEDLDGPVRPKKGMNAEFTVTIRNKGGSEGMYREVFHVDGPGDDTGGTAEYNISPGSTINRSFTVEVEKYGTYQVSIGGIETSFDAAPWPYGTAVRAPNGTRHTVSDLTLADEYWYDGPGRTGGKISAPEGQQFALVKYTVENPTEEESSGFGWSSFSITNGITKYDATKTPGLGHKSIRGPVTGPEFYHTFSVDLDPGDSYEGWILFEVPERRAREGLVTQVDHWYGEEPMKWI